MYLVFAFYTYYPTGGWSDYHAKYDTIEEARDACKNLKERFNHTQIVNSFTLQVEEED